MRPTEIPHKTVAYLITHIHIPSWTFQDRGGGGAAFGEVNLIVFFLWVGGGEYYSSQVFEGGEQNVTVKLAMCSI